MVLWLTPRFGACITTRTDVIHSGIILLLGSSAHVELLVCVHLYVVVSLIVTPPTEKVE